MLHRSLICVSCQDGGDPAVEASPRDIMYTLDAAHAEAEPEKLAETDLRYSQQS